MFFRIFSILVCGSSLVQASAWAEYEAWQHSGVMHVLTTPEGADLPASAVELDFPILVRLHHQFFDFSEALPLGQDIRFSANGSPLSYQIEVWDPDGGHAEIWVRIPQIRGNEQQAIKMHWGNQQVSSQSNSEQVFSTTTGFAGVWHLGDTLDDATSNHLDGFNRVDKPTVSTSGVIGDAREFGVERMLVIRPRGAKQDRRVTCMPSGNEDRTLSAWVKPRDFQSHRWASATIGGWGEPEPGQKPQMGLSYFTMTGRGQPRFHLYGFDPRGESRIPRDQWRHLAISISKDRVRFYLDGVLDRTIDNHGAAVTRLGTLKTPVSTAVDLGDHGNGRGPFNGALDEVRFESKARSADWLKLCYENQKPLQKLVGPLVPAGDSFSVSPSRVIMKENETTDFHIAAGGVRKIYWILKDGDQFQTLAVDRLRYTYRARRVSKDTEVVLLVKAVSDSGVRTQEIPVVIQESIPDPEFSLEVPKVWNGRDPLVLSPRIHNRSELSHCDAEKFSYSWSVRGMATIHQTKSEQLHLIRAQNSGTVTIELSLNNGGRVVTRSKQIIVKEPVSDPWVLRIPTDDEMPVDHQFYARDDRGLGTLHCRGTLAEPADSVFLRLYRGDTLVVAERKKVGDNLKYTLSTALEPGLVAYRSEFGVVNAGVEKILERAEDLVCGDVFVIQGQSNAEAWTDDRVVHPYRSPWLRSFGTPTTNPDRARDVVWGNALSFNGGSHHHHLQIGYWGVELGKLLIEKYQVPVCIVNGAQGGTRIDQHQRNESNPLDVKTIYGRLLWRLKEARLDHGVRAIIWHQGENDQGESGATGEFGWVNYQELFVRMAASWKQDYPNVQHYYVHQIWPGACGGRSIESDRLRERQRRLPEQFSKMSLLSTLGIRPGGGCHYAPEGYVAMARQLFPVISQNHYGEKYAVPVTSPMIQRAIYSTENRDEVTLVFDQSVNCKGTLTKQFFLDGNQPECLSVRSDANTVTIKLARSSTATHLSYVRSGMWSESDDMIWGENKLAALTFCELPIAPFPTKKK